MIIGIGAYGELAAVDRQITARGYINGLIVAAMSAVDFAVAIDDKAPVHPDCDTCRVVRNRMSVQIEDHRRALGYGDHLVEGYILGQFYLTSVCSRHYQFLRTSIGIDVVAIINRVDRDVECNVARQELAEDIRTPVALYGHACQTVFQCNIVTGFRLERELQPFQRSFLGTVHAAVIYQNITHGKPVVGLTVTNISVFVRIDFQLLRRNCCKIVCYVCGVAYRTRNEVERCRRIFNDHFRLVDCNTRSDSGLPILRGHADIDLCERTFQHDIDRGGTGYSESLRLEESIAGLIVVCCIRIIYRDIHVVIERVGTAIRILCPERDLVSLSLGQSQRFRRGEGNVCSFNLCNAADAITVFIEYGVDQFVGTRAVADCAGFNSDTSFNAK